MPNQITTNGLEIKSLNDIVSDLSAALQAIYGLDINIDQNSPDGQLINIFAQANEDLLELLLATYNSFSVPTAFGVLLDQRVALNGLERKAGTYTQAFVTITVNQALTLTGQDALISDPNAQVFTVADNTGNQYQLKVTHVFGSAGSASLQFQAVDIGQVETLPNTITNQVTTVLGVTTVNNPSTSSDVIGVNEETDAQLKIRHGQSFQLAATSPADAIEAALLNTAGITDALVVENDTGGAVNAIPAHSIWAIVEGGTDAEIGQAIYAKKNPGCGMKGSSSYVITRPNGTTFTAMFDRPIDENLYIQFTILPISGVGNFDTAAIKTALVAALTYKINQLANVGQVVQAMLAIAPAGYLTALGVSINGSDYFDVVTPATYQKKFVLSTARITVNT